MKGQISVEFIITFSLFISLVIILLSSIFLKFDEYNEIQQRQDLILRCKRVGDFIASNLSYKQNELNLSAVSNYLSGSDYSIFWEDNGIHQIGSSNWTYSIERIYIINGSIESVEVRCI